MKSNKMMKLAMCLLVAVALTTCSVSGTFAKYASEVTVSDTARVAKWDIKINNVKQDQWSNSVVFDLFSYTDANVDVDGTGNEKVIAPGTTGEFTFTIANASEVTANYEIAIAETNANNIPIEYKVGNGAWTVPTDGKLTVQSAENIAMGASKDIVVAWRWAFEGADSTNFTTTQTTDTDTALGTAGTATVTVAATINAVQVD